MYDRSSRSSRWTKASRAARSTVLAMMRICSPAWSSSWVRSRRTKTSPSVARATAKSSVTDRVSLARIVIYCWPPCRISAWTRRSERCAEAFLGSSASMRENMFAASLRRPWA